MTHLATSRPPSIHGAEQLLADYLAGDLPLIGLARRHDLTINQLLAWLDRPDTRRILAALESASRRRAEIIAAMSLPTAMQSLEIVAASAENDETRRKAAAGILRAHHTLTTPPPPPKGALPPRTRPPHPTPMPDARRLMPLRIQTPTPPIFNTALRNNTDHQHPIALNANTTHARHSKPLNTNTTQQYTQSHPRAPPHKLMTPYDVYGRRGKAVFGFATRTFTDAFDPTA